MIDILRECLEEIVPKHNCTFELDFEDGGGAVVNTAECAQFVRQAAIEYYGEEFVGEDHLPVHGSEDFSSYLQELPGCFFFRVISKFKHNHTIHMSDYDFDDGLILDMSEFWFKLAVDRCNFA